MYILESVCTPDLAEEVREGTRGMEGLIIEAEVSCYKAEALEECITMSDDSLEEPFSRAATTDILSMWKCTS